MRLLRRFRNLLPKKLSARNEHAERSEFPVFPHLPLTHLGLSTAFTLHNIGNILTLVRLLHAEYAEKLSHEENQTLLANYELLEGIVREALRSLHSQTTSEVFSIQESLNEVRNIFRHVSQYPLHALTITCPPDWTLLGSYSVFEQIIANVLENALRSTKDVPNPSLALKVTRTTQETTIVLENTLSKEQGPKPGSYGLGIPSIYFAMKTSFQGSCSFEQQEKIFRVTLSFPHQTSLSGGFSSSSLQ